ncbi:hypothetical protein HZB88_04170 [archaeon]|nr:hypothetical protein [archaeon]
MSKEIYKEVYRTEKVKAQIPIDGSSQTGELYIILLQDIRTKKYVLRPLFETGQNCFTRAMPLRNDLDEEAARKAVYTFLGMCLAGRRTNGWIAIERGLLEPRPDARDELDATGKPLEQRV